MAGLAGQSPRLLDTPSSPTAWAGDPTRRPRRGPYPAGQHAQGPLVKVHDGVVLPLVVVDLLGPQ